MSHRTKQAATSRRTRRADQRQPAPAHPTIVCNNPIFFREHGRTEADSLHALVHDLPAAVVKPLPLPPCRTPLPPGSGRAGSALVMSRHGSGWVVLRRVPRDDPFLAAYVACAKNGGMIDAAPANRQRRKQNRDKNRGDTVQGCGIWSGWAAGAWFARAMSCKYVCDVVAMQADGRPSAAAAQAQGQASPVPRLHLSRQLVVIPARKRDLARGRVQG
ncbi:unnamed protein product [Alopecurus aequalis]